MHQICRTCLKEIEGINFINLKDDTNSSEMQSKLLLCTPELNVDLVLGPVLCTSCVDALNLAYIFKTTCLHTEKLIQSYVDTNKLEPNSILLTDFNLQAYLLQASHSNSNAVLKTETIENDSAKFEFRDVNNIEDMEDIIIKEESTEWESPTFLEELEWVERASGVNTLSTTLVASSSPAPTPDHQTTEEEFDDISEDTLARAKNATEDLLPTKSRALYDKEFKIFVNWKLKNDVAVVNETVMMAYFQELSEKYTPNSLWTKYSILKTTLGVNDNVDISRYNRLMSFLKQRSKGYIPKKSKVLTGDQILTFIKDAPNDTYLLHKVVLVMGVFGGLKRDEMVRMTIDNVQDKGGVLLVNVPETKTAEARDFTIVEEEEIGALKLVQQYAALRPTGVRERRFFLSYRNNCCTAQPVGKNTIGSVPTIIARYLKLDNPKEYTGHCLRHMSSTLLVEADATFETLKMNRKRKSADVAKGYIAGIMASKKRIARMITSSVGTSEEGKGESSTSVCQDFNPQVSLLQASSDEDSNITLKTETIEYKDVNNIKDTQDTIIKEESNEWESPTSLEELEWVERASGGNTSSKTLDSSASPTAPPDHQTVEEEFDDISEDTLARAKNATEDLLPTKSRALYDKEFKLFVNWKLRNKVTVVNETVIMAYFQELSEKYTPNSLWTKYSILKLTLIVNDNIDISHYNSLVLFLKEISKGYIPKKSKVLTRDQILTFMKDAPNETYLMHKVVLVMGVFGGLKRNEMVRMTIDDIQDKGCVLLIQVPESKTGEAKGFTIVEEEEIGALKLVQQYVALRPTGIRERRFFLTYRNNCCTGQPVGKNTIGSVATIIAKYLKLDNAKEYTGSCLRHIAVAEGFIAESMISKNKIARMIAGSVDTSGEGKGESSSSMCQDFNLQTYLLQGSSDEDSNGMLKTEKIELNNINHANDIKIKEESNEWECPTSLEKLEWVERVNTSSKTLDASAGPAPTPDHQMMEAEFDDISEDILAGAKNAPEDLLPANSRARYDKEFKIFVNWKLKNAVTVVNETVMMAYFQELSEKYTPNSLWTKYSILKSTLMVKDNVDISHYNLLVSFLKESSKGYIPKKTKVLTQDQVLTFMKDAPNDTHLLHKVVLVMGVFGGLKRNEMVRMTIDDIQDKGCVLLVKVPETKTAAARGFTIVEEEEIGALKLVQQYAALRPTGIRERRFFLTYRNNCCTAQPVGKNTIGSVPTIIATYLKLDNAKEYTGHCLRRTRTSSTLLVEAGATFETLKMHRKRKCTTVAERYTAERMAAKNRIARTIESSVVTSGEGNGESSSSMYEAEESIARS